VLREQQNHGQLDMEATEMAVRSSMHEAGGVVLEKLVNLDDVVLSKNRNGDQVQIARRFRQEL